jgi:hypothetical protein
MKSVEDNVYVGQSLIHGPEVGAAHVHCHNCEFLAFPGRDFQKGQDVLFAFPFYRMLDSAGPQLGHHGHLLMALFGAIRACVCRKTLKYFQEQCVAL